VGVAVALGLTLAVIEFGCPDHADEQARVEIAVPSGDTPEGDVLLFHELVHATQQSGPAAPSSAATSALHDAAERAVTEFGPRGTVKDFNQRHSVRYHPPRPTTSDVQPSSQMESERELLVELALAFEDLARERTGRKPNQAASNAASRASWVMAQIFGTVSWDVQRRELRERDPRDFVDTHGIGLGKSVKYGMADPEEDEATFTTMIYIMERDEARSPETDLIGYVLAQLAIDNVEPALKYLCVQYALTLGGFRSDESCTRTVPDPTQRVRAALDLAERSRPAPLRPHLARALSALRAAEAFLTEQCR
jgi:hypothetical protein